MKSQTNPAQTRPRLKGNLANFLLLGFLAGLITANFAPAVELSITTMLTISGLTASLVFSQFFDSRKRRAEQNANEQAVSLLERRMERLIPRMHIKTHGGHSHGPHGREDLEFPSKGSKRPQQVASSPAHRPQ